jgi:hypothetical protein
MERVGQSLLPRAWLTVREGHTNKIRGIKSEQRTKLLPGTHSHDYLDNHARRLSL